jgi:hypothetical protein
MQMSVKAFAIACGITFALAMLVGGIMALIWPEWGARFMNLAGALYPGVGGVAFGSVIVATLYALVDGAIFGAIFAWLYNRFAGAGVAAPA